jgi:hypothetical protein
MLVACNKRVMLSDASAMKKILADLAGHAPPLRLKVGQVCLTIGFRTRPLYGKRGVGIEPHGDGARMSYSG